MNKMTDYVTQADLELLRNQIAQALEGTASQMDMRIEAIDLLLEAIEQQVGAMAAALANCTTVLEAMTVVVEAQGDEVKTAFTVKLSEAQKVIKQLMENPFGSNPSDESPAESTASDVAG